MQQYQQPEALPVFVMPGDKARNTKNTSSILPQDQQQTQSNDALRSAQLMQTGQAIANLNGVMSTTTAQERDEHIRNQQLVRAALAGRLHSSGSGRSAQKTVH